ncbi:MAG: hydrogenase maturation protease [bacterium]
MTAVAENDAVMPDYCRARVVVLGCGNILFGDDGFGPAVADYLATHLTVPADTCVINAGLSAREILFTLVLSEIRPQEIIIVDAVDARKTPGEIFEIDISEVPEKKIDDFSMHQLPASNLLRELKEFRGVDVRIVAVQVQDIPDSVRPGLSSAVCNAVPLACSRILAEIGRNRVKQPDDPSAACSP